MLRFHKALLCLALLPVTLIALIGVIFMLLNSATYVSSSAASFEVARGESLTYLVRRLDDQGLIQNPKILVLYARLMGRTNVKRGEYQLPNRVSDLEILERLLSGDVVTRKVTFVEGTTFKDALQSLAKHSVKSELLGKTAENVGEILGLKPGNPEGWLFPDTYQYTKDMTDLDILKQSAVLMQRVLAEEWEGRASDLPYETSYEALIMASIIEKETGVPSERKAIAGVFVRRLQTGMRLQTDPTVIYGLGDQYRGNIRRRHLKQATPYNTYVINGLPPTPIALPGRAAIHAALHPAAGTELFFVAKGDGSHQFSNTLEEHVSAVREYQLRRNSDYRSSPK